MSSTASNTQVSQPRIQIHSEQELIRNLILYWPSYEKPEVMAEVYRILIGGIKELPA